MGTTYIRMFLREGTDNCRQLSWIASCWSPERTDSDRSEVAVRPTATFDFDVAFRAVKLVGPGFHVNENKVPRAGSIRLRISQCSTTMLR